MIGRERVSLTWEEEEALEQEFLFSVPQWRKWVGILASLSGVGLVGWSSAGSSSGRQVVKQLKKKETWGVALLCAGAFCLWPLASPRPEPFVRLSPTHDRARPRDSRRELEFRVLNKRWRGQIQALEEEVGFRPFWFPKRVRKKFDEARREERKARRAALLEMEAGLEEAVEKDLDVLSTKEILQKLSKRVYVLDFADYDYSIPRSEELEEQDSGKRRLESTPEWVGFLRDAVSFLLQCANKFDEVVIRLCSPGGTVSEYGLAASQLSRLRRAGLDVTVCIDTVAASGGYMLAACASKIVAAPFALVGSIGVVAELPNFHRLLQKYDVDYLLFTAGEYKRTVHSLAENSEEGMTKFREELEDIHQAFKDHIVANRGREKVKDVSATATGEAWLASRAKEKGLVDELLCSDEYLDQKEREGYDLIQISLKTTRKRKLSSFLWDYLDITGLSSNLLQDMLSPLPMAFKAKFGWRPIARL